MSVDSILHSSTWAIDNTETNNTATSFRPSRRVPSIEIMEFRRTILIIFAAMVVVFGLIVNALLLSGLVATNSRNIQSLGQSAIVLLYPLQEQQHQTHQEHEQQLFIHNSTISAPQPHHHHHHHQLQYHHGKLMFVHIGKTAGETLKHHLRVTCTTPRRNAVKRSNCYKEWQTTVQNNDSNQTTATTTTMNVVRHESEISKRTMGYMHCNLLQPSSRGGINATIHGEITSHLFCIRSPINRILSWFRYIHPNGCSNTRHDTANCVYKRRIVHENNTFVATFANCFPTLLHFLDSLGPPTAVSSSNNDSRSLEICAQTAHAILQATSTNVRVMGHSYFNFDYYANRTLRRYANRHVLAIRTEHFWSDFLQLDYLLGGRGKYQHPNGITAYRHDSKYIVPINMTTSAKGIFNLCCALLQDHHHDGMDDDSSSSTSTSEIAVYLEILERADNLNATTKLQSKMALLQQCGGFQSLDDLTKTCRRDQQQLQISR